MVVSSAIRILLGGLLFAAFYRTGEQGKMPTMGIMGLLLILSGIGFVDPFRGENYLLFIEIIAAVIFFAAKSVPIKIAGFLTTTVIFVFPIVRNIGGLWGVGMIFIAILAMSFVRGETPQKVVQCVEQEVINPIEKVPEVVQKVFNDEYLDLP